VPRFGLVEVGWAEAMTLGSYGVVHVYLGATVTS